MRVRFPAKGTQGDIYIFHFCCTATKLRHVAVCDELFIKVHVIRS